MSLQKGLEQMERHFDGKRKRSRRWLKKMRNKFLRRISKEEVPNTKYRRGWEY